MLSNTSLLVAEIGLPRPWETASMHRHPRTNVPYIWSNRPIYVGLSVYVVIKMYAITVLDFFAIDI